MTSSRESDKGILRPLVPPLFAALASLLIPGSGQLLNRQVRRGLVIFGSLVSITGLTLWRMVGLGFREDTPADIFSIAVARSTFFMVFVLTCTAVLWAWNVRDAYSAARKRKPNGPSIFIVILLAFFALGWQISRIDLVKMVRELPAALPPLSRILWPWEAALTYKEETLKAGAPILAAMDQEDAPPPPQIVEGEPHLEVDPTFGRLSTRNEQNELVPGTEITVTGTGFTPNSRTEIWWVDPMGNEFRPREDGQYLAVTTDDAGAFEIRMRMPYRLTPPSTEGHQFHRVEARQISKVGSPLPSEPLQLTVGRMIETIFMGMMATIFGIVLSVPFGFLAARNIMSGSRVTMAVYYLTRTVLSIIRSIEALIWALIVVVWVGLGPFAGVIALTLHSVASLGKLYSKAIEGIDQGPIEAIQATGANALQTFVYAVIPQMIGPFVSFSTYRWDINLRMSTVIGLVGGGGVGFILVQHIRLLDYKAAGIAVWVIAVTVAVLDYVSSEIRNRFT